MVWFVKNSIATNYSHPGRHNVGDINLTVVHSQFLTIDDQTWYNGDVQV